MNKKMRVKIGYSYKKWQLGIKAPFIWDTGIVPHMLISGVTGGTKSVTAQMIVNQILDTDSEIWIMDYKAGGDWDNVVSRYAEYTKCDDLIREYYESFIATIERKGYEESYLVFDEFSSYALSKDTKQFKELMSMISHIAFMGRSFGYHLILISQQFNAKVIDTAIREQFGIKIYMGSTISTESATMLFPNSDINKSIHLPRFCGYISMPEKELDIIQIPYLQNAKKLKMLLEKKEKNK